MSKPLDFESSSSGMGTTGVEMVIMESTPGVVRFEVIFSSE